MSTQSKLMKFNPCTGEEKPYPSEAKQFRDYWGQSSAWLFNPWTGKRRHYKDIGSDVTGLLVTTNN